MKNLIRDSLCLSIIRKVQRLLLVSLAITSMVPLSRATFQAQDISRPKSSPPETATRRVLVRSKALLVRAAVLEEKLLKRPEFNQLRLVITRDESEADIILELRHDLLTKYVFTVVDTRTQTVLAGGKVSSLGGTVAGKVAKRFVKEMARSPTL
jgi:hypothetical protein